ncbi:Pvc16 family protein [Microbacterium sp. Root180]|uniref:Pvc16 family protein n=1 Tax=Microbacterium sp. Root180 TaxID=1736483 RepID=UPI000B214D7D|nr:Pvc16 family protein [Microbacterium sp. Root180]
MIREVSDALIDVIHTATPDLGEWVEISSLSAADQAPTANKASLALIAVEPHPHMLNRPLVEGVAGLVRAPLHLKLRYLITYTGPHDEAQTRIARIVQAFHSTPIVDGTTLQPPLSDEVDSIAIRMLTPTADERNQVWGALGRPARLALFYEVDVAPVPVRELEGAGRIRAHEVRYVGAP